MEAGVSVIICTYNGAPLLPATLQHLAAQKVAPEIPWEVLVIDNASTDNSAEVAEAVWNNTAMPTTFSVIHEPKAGLSFARETGLARSRFEFVLFCDDDNWLCPDYIERAFNLMLQHPEIGMLGGNGQLVFQENETLKGQFPNLFASGPQAKNSGRVKRNVVYGAGAIMRRNAFEILQKAGFRSRLTDRKGATLSSGGDYELCYALALAGFQIWYDERLRFQHFIPAKRLTTAYYEKYFRENARSFSCLIPYRFVVNKNCTTEAGFHFHSLKTVAFYAAKLLSVLISRILSGPASVTAENNRLSNQAIKFKILSFRQYSTMLQNFRELLLLSDTLKQTADSPHKGRLFTRMTTPSIPGLTAQNPRSSK